MKAQPGTTVNTIDLNGCALEAADCADWQPLIHIWQQRFTTVPQNP